MSVLCVPLFGLVDVYGIAHLLFGIPLASLLEPFGVLSIPVLLVGPSMYLVNKSREELRLKRRTAIVGLFMWSTLILGFHYAAQLGIIETGDEIPMFVICTVGIGLATVGAYQLRKNANG
jgi:hypothetical protein